jgi:hypothetical protein
MTTLPASGAAGDVLVRLERDGHDDDVPVRGGLLGGAGTGVVAQLRHEVDEGVRAAGVADDGSLAVVDGEAGESTADVAGADESDRGHAGPTGCGPSLFLVIVKCVRPPENPLAAGASRT